MKKKVLLSIAVLICNYFACTSQTISYPDKIIDSLFVQKDSSKSFFCMECVYNIGMRKVGSDISNEISTAVRTYDCTHKLFKNNNRSVFLTPNSFLTFRFNLPGLYSEYFPDILVIEQCNLYDEDARLIVEMTSRHVHYTDTVLYREDSDKVLIPLFNRQIELNELDVKIKVIEAHGYFQLKNVYVKLSEVRDIDLESTDLFKNIEQNDHTYKLTLNNVLFETDQYNLTDEAQNMLTEITGYLKKTNNLFIQIKGYTDNVGSREYNLELSQKRAKSVYKYFLDSGINKSRLSFKGYGESTPVEKNNTDENREKNRRVEIWIFNQK